jgi:hypothetical protein
MSPYVHFTELADSQGNFSAIILRERLVTRLRFFWGRAAIYQFFAVALLELQF